MQGARALLSSLGESGEAGLVPEGFLHFRDGLTARGPLGTGELSASQAKLPLCGARIYLRFKIESGALPLFDWLLLAYPGSFADVWRLAELRPLKPELSAFMASLRARRYSSSAPRSTAAARCCCSCTCGPYARRRASFRPRTGRASRRPCWRRAGAATSCRRRRSAW
jgi:hypothetical protein